MSADTVIDGYHIGQQVWFVRSGLVVSGVIISFRPWITDGSRFKATVANLTVGDDLTASVSTEDLFSSEVPATEFLLDEAVRQVSFLRLRLRELAKATTQKAAKPKTRRATA